MSTLERRWGVPEWAEGAGPATAVLSAGLPPAGWDELEELVGVAGRPLATQLELVILASLGGRAYGLACARGASGRVIAPVWVEDLVAAWRGERTPSTSQGPTVLWLDPSVEDWSAQTRSGTLVRYRSNEGELEALRG